MKRRHLILEAEPGRYEIKSGLGQLQVLEPDGSPKPQPPSMAQEQYRAARLNEYVAEALVYTAGKPDFIDLYKALECLEAGKFFNKRNRNSVTEHFRHTANAVFRHRSGKYKLPDKPMTIDDARRHLRSLVNQAIASVLAANPQ